MARKAPRGVLQPALDGVVDAANRSGVFPSPTDVHYSSARPQDHRIVLGIVQHLEWGGGISLVVGFVLGAFFDRPPRGSGLYGKAHFATARDIVRSTLRQSQTGIVLGQTKRGELLIRGGSQNVLVLGPPGLGKTDGTAVTTLRGGWEGSAIVFDPADELRARTIEARRHIGPVIVFDRRDPKTARINVLAGIRPDDVDAVRSIMTAFVADAAEFAEIPEQAKFFLSGAIELSTAVVLRVLELGQLSLEAAAHYFYNPDLQERSAVRRAAARRVPDRLRARDRCQVRQYGPALALEHHRDGDAALRHLPDAQRREGDDHLRFKPDLLRRRAATLYLVAREADEIEYAPLMRTVLTWLLADLTAAIPAGDEQRILLLLDEFPLLKAPVIEQKLATLRKYRIVVMLLAQTLSQIRKIYGQYESVTGTCDVTVLFATPDRLTQDYGGHLLGQTTRYAESINRDATAKTTRSVNEVSVPLLQSPNSPNSRRISSSPRRANRRSGRDRSWRESTGASGSSKNQRDDVYEIG